MQERRRRAAVGASCAPELAAIESGGVPLGGGWCVVWGYMHVHVCMYRQLYREYSWLATAASPSPWIFSFSLGLEIPKAAAQLLSTTLTLPSHDT